MNKRMPTPEIFITGSKADRRASIIAAILIVAGAAIMAWLMFLDSDKDLKVCQSYGYDMAMTVDNRKYCGKQYSNGHTVWQRLEWVEKH